MRNGRLLAIVTLAIAMSVSVFGQQQGQGGGGQQELSPYQIWQQKNEQQRNAIQAGQAAHDAQARFEQGQRELELQDYHFKTQVNANQAAQNALLILQGRGRELENQWNKTNTYENWRLGEVKHDADEHGKRLDSDFINFQQNLQRRSGAGGQSVYQAPQSQYQPQSELQRGGGQPPPSQYQYQQQSQPSQYSQYQYGGGQQAQQQQQQRGPSFREMMACFGRDPQQANSWVCQFLREHPDYSPQ